MEYTHLGGVPRAKHVVIRTCGSAIGFSVYCYKNVAAFMDSGEGRGGGLTVTPKFKHVEVKYYVRASCT